MHKVLIDADDIELNVPVTAVFGQPGTFYNRQVIDPGIYGYTINGTINYYDVAFVPFEATKFCSIPGEDLTKFDTPDSMDRKLWLSTKHKKHITSLNHRKDQIILLKIIMITAITTTKGTMDMKMDIPPITKIKMDMKTDTLIIIIMKPQDYY